MTTPKELADKAKQQAHDYALGPGWPLLAKRALHTTIDQLQAMAEARQGSGEPAFWIADIDAKKQRGFLPAYPNEEFKSWPLANVAGQKNYLPLYTAPPSEQQATGTGQVLTDEQIDALWKKWVGTGRPNYSFARAALAAATQAQPEVPTGWKLVPVEPTFDMKVAMDDAWFDNDSGREARVYKAALHAAPTTGKREPLTLDDINDAWASVSDPDAPDISIHDFARAIEKAHGITGEQR